MLGLQNILQQKKKKKTSYKVMWHNMIKNKMNSSFEKFNHVMSHYFVQVFFSFFLFFICKMSYCL